VPIYEYQCSKCGEIFEAFQKMNDNPLKECKFCKGKVERLISQTSFQLKGTGWYVTDYAKKSGSSGRSSDSEAKSTKDSASKTPEKTKDAGPSSSKDAGPSSS
jgi:putative FmdB family regulatory protein